LRPGRTTGARAIQPAQPNPATRRSPGATSAHARRASLFEEQHVLAEAKASLHIRACVACAHAEVLAVKGELPEAIREMATTLVMLEQYAPQGAPFSATSVKVSSTRSGSRACGFRSVRDAHDHRGALPGDRFDSERPAERLDLGLHGAHSHAAA
jgi:hypothetical protein